MLAEARLLLEAGHGVLLDATFTEPRMRGRAEQLAADAGVPFRGAWLEAPLARIAGRTGDASDATLEVLHGQIERRGADIVAWPKVDATAPTEAAVRAWLA